MAMHKHLFVSFMLLNIYYTKKYLDVEEKNNKYKR